jgi:hypothetical protein
MRQWKSRSRRHRCHIDAPKRDLWEAEVAARLRRPPRAGSGALSAGTSLMDEPWGEPSRDARAVLLTTSRILKTASENTHATSYARNMNQVSGNSPNVGYGAIDRALMTRADRPCTFPEHSRNGMSSTRTPLLSRYPFEPGQECHRLTPKTLGHGKNTGPQRRCAPQLRDPLASPIFPGG